MRFFLSGMLCAMLCTSQFAFSQGRTITGKVTSGTEVLSFVTVVVKNTNSGAQTDLDGNYKITIPEGGTVLLFSIIGYKTKELPIPEGTDKLDVQMEQENLQLKQVVVTALGVKREERSLGYSHQQIGGEEVRNSGEHNVVEGLAAKVAGVQVIQAAGTPGASSKILLRGVSDFNGDNQPLFVVDGIPIDNSTSNTIAGDYPFDQNLQGVNVSNRALDINPDDIESISVLKGPAATSIYGSTAGNGVIMITTKKGKGGPIRVTVGSELEFDQVNKLPDLQNTYGQGKGGGLLNPDGSITDGKYGVTSKSWGPKLSGPVYDNTGNFFKTGVLNNNNFSVSGGSDQSSFRLSVGQLRQTGVIPNTDFKRTSFKLSADTKVGNKITVSTTANYINSAATMAQNGSNLSGVMLALLRAPANYDLKGQGDRGYMNPDGTMRTYLPSYDNPLWSVNKNPFTSDVNRFIGTLATTYKPKEWLEFTDRIGTDVYTDSRKQIFAIGSHGGQDDPVGQIEENTQFHSHFYNDLLGTAKHDFNKDFAGSLLLGFNLQGTYDKDLYARGRNLSVPDFYNMSNASNYYSSEGNTTTREAAGFVRVSLSFRNMLYLDLTGREDYFSTFGPAKPNVFLPSASLAWVFTELIPNNKILSFGKLRISTARSGISPAAYQTSTYYSHPTYTDGFTNGLAFPYLLQNGYGYSSLGNLGNSNLRPEIVTGNEIGADLRFFQGRLKLDVTYYDQTTKDILLTRPIAPSSGFKYFTANSGTMQNKGIEIVASATALEFGKFKWDIGGNFTSNKNKVLEIAPGLNQFNITATFGDVEPYVIKGQPYGALYGTKWLRNSNGDLIIDPASGLPKFRATKGIIGNPFPKWTAGVRNTFSFAGFSLTFLFDFRNGGDIWNGTYARLNSLGRTKESADGRNKSYVIKGVNPVIGANGVDTVGYVNNTKAVGSYAYYSQYLGDAGNSARENAIQDGSWVRLRELTISYRFNLKPMVFVKGLEIYATGRNLGLWTKYKGVDPETSLTGAGSNVNGYDYFNNPGSKSYIFGVRASF
jgi:TonB-linked SusC/RagA family outer membrane protein